MLTCGLNALGRLRCEFVEHRYADESGPSWYSGSRYTDPPRYPREPEVSGSHALREEPYDTGSIRLPEQRPADLEPRAPYESGRIPIRGPEYPTIQPPQQQLQNEPTTLVPPVTPERPRAERTRRPVSSVIVAIALLVLFLPVLRLLMSVTFASDPTARGIVPAVLLTLGLALTGFGLFAATGGASVSRDAWMRLPLAYLPAGLIILLAAGLAVA
ncbi:hypothetical protein SAMN06264365_101450 [Actinoplanes regularis]|uniref:Uncharacterized protein n=1 Tax=Actinoplanes regularis TaxID=52697 RepID=A0A238V2B7_9ACTN|nr:hypothetical protein Are01nite_06180 [Actinoplanes regularis]SNR27723.1 hypothetical protein SAMN06264365_101450 [Actinoplanes regularis]